MTGSVCPDCGTDALTGSYGYRRAANREEAMKMPEASCPNRRHDTWKLFLGLPR